MWEESTRETQTVPAGGRRNGACLPTLAAPAIAQSAPEIKWRMTSSFSKSVEAIFGTAQTLCRYVAEATDGKFQIVAHAAGELTSSRQRSTPSPAARSSARTPRSSSMSARTPALGLRHRTSVRAERRQQLSWWTFGGGGDIVNASLKKLNAHGIPAGLTGAQMGAWFKKEINSLDDLKGLRFRIGGIGRADAGARRGGAAAYLPHADVYAALESGTIDAAEFICPYDDEKLGLAEGREVQLLSHAGGKAAAWSIMLVNLEKWNALPKAYQPSSPGPATPPNSWMLAKYDSVNPAGAQTPRRGGAVLKPFPQPVMEAFYRATKEHFAELSAKDLHFKRAFDSMQRLPQGAAALVGDLRARLRQLHHQAARGRV